MNPLRWLGVMGMTVGLLVTRSAEASSPAGVWSKVDKVVYEQDAKAPPALRVYGTFLVFKGGGNGTFLDQYTPPTNGSMYFSCDAKQIDDCLLAWKEIEENAAATEDQCVGFGDQKTPYSTLYPVCQEPASAEPFNLALGVVSGYTPCEAIKNFRAKEGGYPTCGSGGNGGAGGSGNGGNGGSGQAGQGGENGSTAGSGGAGNTAGSGAGTSSGGSSSGQAGAMSGGSGGDKPAGQAGSTSGAGGSSAGRAGNGAAGADGPSGAGGSTVSSASETRTDSKDDSGCSASGRPAASSWLLGFGLAWALYRLRRKAD